LWSDAIFNKFNSGFKIHVILPLHSPFIEQLRYPYLERLLDKELMQGTHSERRGGAIQAVLIYHHYTIIL